MKNYILIIIILFYYKILLVTSQNITKLNDKLVYVGDGWNYVFDIIIYSDNVDLYPAATTTPSTFTREYYLNNYYYYKLTIPYAGDGSFIEPTIISNLNTLFLGTYSYTDQNNSWELEMILEPTLVYQSQNQITFQSTIKIKNMDPLIIYEKLTVICTPSTLYSCSISHNTGDSYLFTYVQYSKDVVETKTLSVTIKAGLNSVLHTFSLNYDDFKYYSISNIYSVMSRMYYFSLASSAYNNSTSNFGVYDLLNNNIIGLKYPVEGVPGNATFLVNSQLPSGSKYTDSSSIGILGISNSLLPMTVGYVENPNDIPVAQPNIFSDVTSQEYTNGNGYSMISVKLNTNRTSTFMSDGYSTVYHDFPFGYTQFVSNDPITALTYQKSILIIVYPLQLITISIDALIYTTPNEPPIDLRPPTIRSFSLNTIDSKLFVMRISVTDDVSGFKSFKYRGITITSENLVYGNLTNGTFEKYFNPIYDNYQPTNEYPIYIMDFAQKITKYNSSVYLIESPSSILYFESPSINRQEFNYENITSFQFSSDQNKPIDTTGKDIQLQVLFNVTIPKKDEIVYISLSKNRLTLQDINYYSKNGYIYQGFWNGTLKLYQIDFTIKRNQFTTSNLDYQIFFDSASVYSKEIQNHLPNSNSKLNVYSNYADTLGPLVTSVGTFIKPVGSLTKIGWNFTMEYNLNKIKTGYSIIQNRQNLAFYNITLEKIDDHLYQAGLFVYPNCTSSEYHLNYTLFEDEGGYKTIFDNQNNLNTPIPSPFIKSSLLLLSKQCGTNPLDDLKAPVLKQFNINKTSISFGSDRIIEITFEFQDDSGIDLDFLPYVYLTTTHLSSYLKLQAQVVGKSQDSTLVQYKVVTEVPRGFGYPHPILVNIYSVYDLFGHFTGLSADDLKSQNYISLIETSNAGLDSTYFSNISPITVNGGYLTVKGNSFKKNDTPISISIDYSTGYDEFTQPLLLESTVFIINIKPTQYQFILKAWYNGIELDRRTVYPIGWEAQPPTTPPPTNSPPINQPKCPNNCGAPSNGICSTTTFTCICYSPWVGSDCLSKIIIISPPIINTTSPNVNITIPNDPSTNSQENSNSDDDDSSLKSLISIVELRELSIDGLIVNRFKFEDWIFTNQSSSDEIKYYYTSTIKINQGGDDQDDNSFKINVLIQYFKNETIINFADSNITMLESSLKYNVNISSYPFTSSLNTLLLVMSTSIQSNSNSNDICSSKDFGYLDSVNQFITVQVDRYTLYGRFINRGIIDSKVQKIENVLLNSDSYLIDNSNSKISKSFIGIKIPYFRGIAQLDPDFLILISNNKANSICDKSGLTNGAIAGIIVGGVVFVSIMVVVSILLLKSTRGKLLINNIKLKNLKE